MPAMGTIGTTWPWIRIIGWSPARFGPTTPRSFATTPADQGENDKPHNALGAAKVYRRLVTRYKIY
jgi:hypothetical protein